MITVIIKCKEPIIIAKFVSVPYQYDSSNVETFLQYYVCINLFGHICLSK